MEIKVSRIYTFPSGAKIDLKRIVMIGALDKEIDSGNFIVAVYTEKIDKPIMFRLGWAIGKITEQERQKIMTTLTDFQSEWEQYTLQEEKPS